MTRSWRHLLTLLLFALAASVPEASEAMRAAARLDRVTTTCVSAEAIGTTSSQEPAGEGYAYDQGLRFCDGAGAGRFGAGLEHDPNGYQDSVNLYAYGANDPINHRDPTGREVYVEGLSEEDRQLLLRDLSFITGFSFTVSKEGRLQVDKSARVDGGSQKARDLMLELIESSKIATVNSASRVGFLWMTPVAFGVTNPVLGDVFIDSRDFAQLGGSFRARLSTGMGFAVLHELLHAFGGFATLDPQGDEQLSKPGTIEDRLNEIRTELGLPHRLIYGATVGPDGNVATCNFVFDDEQGGVEYLPFPCEVVGLPERTRERVPHLPKVRGRSR